MPLFDPDVINEIGQRHIGTRPFEQLFHAVGTDLKAHYPNDIYLDQPLVFNSAGGILYQLKIFAMTPTEYIMICGSSISSSGFSGRHPVTFWDTVLSGEARYMHEGELEPRSYKTGDRIFVDRWQTATIDFPDHCWMLEYARGTLPALLPFGMANTIFNSLDFKSAQRLLQIYARLAMRYYRRRPGELPPIAIGATATIAGLWWLRSRDSSRTQRSNDG